MADSYRLVVLKSLTALLQQITPTNGFDFDLSNAVFRGRLTYGDNDPTPMVSILESPRSDMGRFGGAEGSERNETWSLMLQGWVADDIKNPTDPAYALLDAVERQLMKVVEQDPNSGNAVHPQLHMLNGAVASFKVLPGVVRPPAEGVSSKAFFYLPIQVGLVRRFG